MRALVVAGGPGSLSPMGKAASTERRQQPAHNRDGHHDRSRSCRRAAARQAWRRARAPPALIRGVAAMLKRLPSHLLRLTLALACALVATVPAFAQQYQFMPAPQTDLNRVYRIDRQTGEIGACQYGLKDGTIGVTLCYPAGEGAGPQEPSEYALVASRHDREGGIFRVNEKTGAMSVCYIYDEKVVCTPPGR